VYKIDKNYRDISKLRVGCLVAVYTQPFLIYLSYVYGGVCACMSVHVLVISIRWALILIS